MSYGERSCGHYTKGCDLGDDAPCNVDCKEYIWDGMTLPDTKPSPGTAVKRDFDNHPIIFPPLPSIPRHLNRAQRRALVKQRKKARGRK